MSLQEWRVQLYLPSPKWCLLINYSGPLRIKWQIIQHTTFFHIPISTALRQVFGREMQAGSYENGQVGFHSNVWGGKVQTRVGGGVFERTHRHY